MRPVKDLKDLIVGKLTVKEIHSKDRNGHVRWLCECSCGRTHIVLGTHLSRGTVKHCGCSPYRGRVHKQWTGCGEVSGNFWNSVIRGANGAKGRKEIPFEISIEYVWNLFLKQDRKCALSGLPLWFAPTTTTRQSTTASLDRVDSSKGYIKGNVQWVHKDINRMKSFFDQDYFISVCTKVANKSSGGSCEV